MGYIHIRIKAKNYLAHRLAWLYINGAFPNGQLDHIDSNKKNNSFVNLRLVSAQENLKNKRLYKCNRTGYHGITLTKSGKYSAKISINGKSKYIGIFTTLEDAVKERKKFEKLLGFHKNHGKIL
jgi:hypothetical protein